MDFFEKYVAKYTDTKGKRVGLGAAVSLILVGRYLYDLGRPPKHLRALPFANKWAVMKRSIMRGQPITATYEDLYMPLLKKGNGLFVSPERSGWCVQVAHPLAVKQVLMKSDIFPKLAITAAPGTLGYKLGGNANIVFAVDQVWKRHRKIVNPAFHRQLPIKLFGDTAVHFFKVLEREHARTDVFVIDFFKYMEKLTLDVIGHAGFGEMRGEGQLSKEELMNNLIIFFIAGHDTTATALSAAVYWLSKHPDIQEKARQEINRVLCPEGQQEPNSDILPTVEHIKEFKYLNQIIKEGIYWYHISSSAHLSSSSALRLDGPATILATPRVASKDVELAGSGIVIPKGTKLNINVYGMHHWHAIWKDPDTFNPDRFAEGGEADQKTGLAWTPFSNGQRQCLGMGFSLNEQRVVLAMLLRRYEFSLPEDSIHHDSYVTTTSALLTPVNLKIQFKKRF
ncbi:cytochrome P450 [Hesseltinella vesiculosa]|uniref:Cytochrome P450 n=1 Tax=Hesseltinella vesiculosa TaxID=101127 RepID=A0A1X2GKD7_9FUNG|nr:cytochrome P450 [Hesseltinella vesiculosa]